MKSVALHNLGCKVNAYELEVMQQKLKESGYKIVSFDLAADVYIINTCSVTNMADRKSRQMIHRAKQKNPEAVVVAAGCYVQTGTEQVLKDQGVDLLIGNNRKKDIVEILEQYFEERDKTLNGTTVIDINHTDEYEEMQLKHTGDHTRACIKIQDGCNQFCSYCIIPYARGRVRSRRPEDVLSEIRGLAKTGYKEVVITGIHLSSYGMDFIGKNDGDYLEGGKDLRETAFKRAYLISLIEEIGKIDGIERIRLGSLEPRIITEEFAERLAAIPKVCPHFHLSLQSGSLATLKRMNRHYTPEEYYEKVQILRNTFQNPAITTDVIVGFPGETEEEFEETKAFLEKIRFYEMHIFKYSRRKGTVADKLKDQIPEPVKTKRSEELQLMEERHSKAYREGYLNKELEVLAEEKKVIDKKEYWLGHTKTYIKCAFLSDEECNNKMISGRAAGFLAQNILLLDEIH